MIREIRNTCTWVLPLIALIGGFWLGQQWDASTLHAKDSDTSELGDTYTFINPLLFCTDQDFSNYTGALSDKIEASVQQYLDSAKQSGAITDASVYFRDLNLGPWALVNSTLRSVPGSLFKVPVAISAYYHAERDPAFLARTVAMNSASNPDQGQHFQPAEHIEMGRPYSVKDLITYTLVDSDNAAMLALSSQLSNDEQLRSFQHFGIEIPTSNNRDDYTMTVRTYASFFRILYNASYLNRESSEELLSLLTESNFTQGLVAGLPKGIKVAHKFGEIITESGAEQLHDCGIIYKPHHPYLLCVMTQGRDFDKLATFISTTSKKVWDILEEQQ